MTSPDPTPADHRPQQEPAVQRAGAPDPGEEATAAAAGKRFLDAYAGNTRATPVATYLGFVIVTLFGVICLVSAIGSLTGLMPGVIDNTLDRFIALVLGLGFCGFGWILWQVIRRNAR